jgi:hypothetical protein
MSERGDVIDQANARADRDTALSLAFVRKQSASIPVGAAGECDLRGEWSGRLINGACAPCRDKYKLP